MYREGTNLDMIAYIKLYEQNSGDSESNEQIPRVFLAVDQSNVTAKKIVIHIFEDWKFEAN